MSQKDCVGKLTPGINGPTGQAGIKDADDTLAALLAWLKANKLDKTTDVFVTADHGFSTIDKPRRIRRGAAVRIPRRRSRQGARSPGRRKAMPRIGKDPSIPTCWWSPNGGSDLIYLLGADTKVRAAQVVDRLTKLDYISGVFVERRSRRHPGQPADERDQLARHGDHAASRHRGEFRLASHQGLQARADVRGRNRRHLARHRPGHARHASAAPIRATSWRRSGPDFKARFADKAPVSNADINPTLARSWASRSGPRVA